MMRKLSVLPYLLILLLSLHVVRGQNTIDYIQLDNLHIQDGSVNLIETAEGNFVSVGYWESEGWMAKFNPCGAIIWMKRYTFGNSETRLWDVRELPDGDLIVVGHADTTQLLPNEPDIPAVLVMRTDACGNVEQERRVAIPAGGLPIPFSTPTVGYGMDLTPQGGVVVTGQNFAIDITNLVPLEGFARKAAFIFELDSNLQVVGYDNFSALPREDSLVGYDIMTLSDGYVLAGSYYDPAVDSGYIYALKTDFQRQTQWLKRWHGVPPNLVLPGTTTDLGFYHTATSIDTLPSGQLVLGGSRYRNPFDFIDPTILTVDPANGDLLNTRDFANIGLDLGMRVRAYPQGVLLSGAMTIFDGVDWVFASAVWEMDLQGQAANLYTYTDSTEFFFLNTSIVPLSGSYGGDHAVAGLRYLPNTADTSQSITFFNATAEDANAPPSARYYGGVIVQIEDVNIRDTILCRPAGPPVNCEVLLTSLNPSLSKPGRVYPVPSCDLLYVEWSQPAPPGALIRVYSAAGREMGAYPIKAGLTKGQIDLAALPPGGYILQGWDGLWWKAMRAP